MESRSLRRKLVHGLLTFRLRKLTEPPVSARLNARLVGTGRVLLMTPAKWGGVIAETTFNGRARSVDRASPHRPAVTRR